MRSTHSPRRLRRGAAAGLGLAVATATVLAGCSTADTDDDTEASEVAYGATAAEYEAALAEMDPVELIVQASASSPDHHNAVPWQLFMDRVTEYSGGKITFEMTWANGIVSSVLDNDDALIDGRLDISPWWPQYDSAEYPANNAFIDASVLRDGGIVTGWYSAQAWMQEVGLSTPEITAEWENKGFIPLGIMMPDGPSILACREPVTSLADLEGKQVRSGGTVHSRQLEGLGAIPVSLPFPEVYEALQRGILDCSMSGHELATTYGHLEVAPNVIHTQVASLASTPTNYFAGPRVASLPVAAQQLIVESWQYYIADLFAPRLDRLVEETIPLSTQHGGEWLVVDAEVEERLAEINAEILADLAESPYFDGADLIERSEAANAAWVDRVHELGFADQGTTADFASWFSSSDPQPWIDAVITEILTKYSPV